MFFISSVTGEQTPLPSDSAQSIGAVQSTSTVGPVAGGTRSSVSINSAAAAANTAGAVASAALEQEAVVVGGKVTDPLSMVTNGLLRANAPIGTNVARAAGISSYQTAEAARVTREKAVAGVHRETVVLPTAGAHQADSLDDHSGNGPEQVARDPYWDTSGGKERAPAVTAAQIMTSPVFALEASDKLSKAWHLIKSRRFRHVPVVSKAGKLVGIISDRDFIAPLEGLGSIAKSLMAVSEADMPISSRMKTNILTARPEAEIRWIARVMIDHRVGSMPIVDAAGRLVGILTRSDILRAVVRHAPIELWT